VSDGNKNTEQEFVMLFTVFDEGNYPVGVLWSEVHALAIV